MKFEAAIPPGYLIDAHIFLDKRSEVKAFGRVGYCHLFSEFLLIIMKQ